MQIGAQFSIYASDYEVTFVGRDGIRVNAVSGGSSKQLSFASVEELVENRAIQVNFTPAAGMEGSRAGLTEAQCDCLNRKIIYVRAVHKNAQHPGSQRAIAPVIQSAAKELNDQHPPGVSTVAGWVKKWVSGGCCDAALMPALKGSRARRLGSDPLERIITEAIQDVYLTSQRNPITAVRAQVAIAIAEYNRAADEPLTEPSYEYLRRIIQRIDHYKRDLARHGRHYAKRRHRAAGVSTVTTEPLELVEADGQMVDAVVCEKNEDGTIGREIGRAYVTVMLDVHDRCILSAYPSLAPFCGGTLLKTLSIACIADRDKPRGVPQKLIVDNGCDYQDSGFLRACNRIGVIVGEILPPQHFQRGRPV